MFRGPDHRHGAHFRQCEGRQVACGCPQGPVAGIEEGPGVGDSAWEGRALDCERRRPGGARPEGVGQGQFWVGDAWLPPRHACRCQERAVLGPHRRCKQTSVPDQRDSSPSPHPPSMRRPLWRGLHGLGAGRGLAGLGVGARHDPRPVRTSPLRGLRSPHPPAAPPGPRLRAPLPARAGAADRPRRSEGQQRPRRPQDPPREAH
mmetsp:Transcript_68893/g.205018  ORF Transcript_68893/g.205018 Transcript_68893/m.205018 type:complete len:204 (+) Transcript_68893:1233-1844(+)